MDEVVTPETDRGCGGRGGSKSRRARRTLASPFQEAGAGSQTRIHLMVNTGVAGTLRSIDPWAST